MGMSAHKNADSVAFAAAQALTDTRKSAGQAWIIRRGSFTLNASSNATISDASFTALTVVDVYLTGFAGTALGVNYKQTATAGQVVVQAVSSSGASITTDQSTFSYVAATPVYHGDQTASTVPSDPFNPVATYLTVSATNAVDLPTSIALANQIKYALNAHMADAVAHPNADTTNPVTTANAVDLTTVEALLNACKTAFNAHIALAASHVFVDTVNTVSTASATDLASSEALANALKTAINAHFAAAPAGESVAMVAA